MQRGSLIRKNLRRGADVWQFRWSEYPLTGKRVYRKRVIGTVDQYPNADAARRAVAALVLGINSADLRMRPKSMTIAQLCDHFEQRELARDNTWRSYSTKKIYRAYLRRWVIPTWGKDELANIRTIEVESWLRCLPLARSSCAKIET